MSRKGIKTILVIVVMFFCYQLFWIFSLENNKEINKIANLTNEKKYYLLPFYKKSIEIKEVLIKNKIFYRVNCKNKNPIINNETFYAFESEKKNFNNSWNLFYEKETIFIRYKIYLFFFWEMDYKIILNIKKNKKNQIEYIYSINKDS